MCYLSGGLFHQNKFPVKFIGPKSVLSLATCVLLFHRCVCLVLFMSSASHPHPLCRSSRSQMFFKIGVSEKFVNDTGKHRCFPVKFEKFLRTPFFTEHLRWLLLCCFSCFFFYFSLAAVRSLLPYSTVTFFI